MISLENVAFQPTTIDRVNIDTTIQRFEFTIELFWKLLKAIIESKGASVQYPKDVLREAFQGGLIDDEQSWISMLHDKNITSHTYDEELADKVFQNIKTYVPILRKTYHILYNQYITVVYLSIFAINVFSNYSHYKT